MPALTPSDCIGAHLRMKPFLGMINILTVQLETFAVFDQLLALMESTVVALFTNFI